MKDKKNIIIALLVVIVAVVGTLVWKSYAANKAQSAANVLPSNLPPPVDPKTIGKVVKDPASGKDFISNQLIVEFNAGVTEEDSLALIASLGGKMEQRFTAAPLFLVRVEDAGDGSGARAAMKKLNADPRVKHADLNFLTTKPTDATNQP